MDARKPINDLLNDLPTTNLTTLALKGLDYVVPGHWENVRDLEQMVRLVTGEDDQALIQRIGERAIVLYTDSTQGYQRAVRVFSLVDSVGTMAGVVTLSHQLGQKFNLSLLKNHTPKPETAQAIDAGVKFAAELVTFTLTNGIPGDSVSDFARAVQQYEKEDVMRLAAFLAFDCVLPLGSEFFSKIFGAIDGLSEEEFANHPRFAKIVEHLPGGIAEQKATVLKNLQEQQAHLEGFVTEKGLTQESLLERVKGWVDSREATLETIAALLDVGTNYFEHTGVQSVARRVVSRAFGEI
ncbi:MAG: hypothetical protein NVS3B20_14470 [Polyangiales bacterium]